MYLPNSLVFMATAAFLLFVVAFASLLRLARSGQVSGRSSDGSASIEAMAHSAIKLVIVLVLTVALSRFLLSPHWPGGPFAPDLAMGLAMGASLIASVPAAGLAILILRRQSGSRGAAFLAFFVLVLVASGGGQAIASGIAAGRDVAALLSPVAILSIVACGGVSCVGVAIHALLVRRIEQRPKDVRLAFVDTVLSATTTVLAIWLACMAYQHAA